MDNTDNNKVEVKIFPVGLKEITRFDIVLYNHPVRSHRDMMFLKHIGSKDPEFNRLKEWVKKQ